MTSTPPLWFLIFAGLLIGLPLGSFVTMLSYRLPRKMSIVRPRSTCPSCQTVLGAKDLVPLFSWLLSKGKCRHCHASIAARYPVIEVVTAVCVTLSVVFLSFDWAWLLGALAFTIIWITGITIGIESARALSAFGEEPPSPQDATTEPQE